MAGRITNAVRRRAIELADAGQSNRSIGRQLGISHTSVAKIRADGPFDPGPNQTRPNPPKRNHQADQPRPPGQARFREGYHDRTYRSSSAPLGFEGWDLDRVRNAITLHDQGYFLESSLLAIVASRFGPVFAALSQAIAPALALPRHVKGATRGLGRVLREEVEAQLAPSDGLMPSPYFPPTLWGAVAVWVRLLGFAVLQHVYGEPGEDGVRPVFTRLWPPWAVRYDRYRRTFVALTTDGPVDIISGDGKFTLVGDTEEPHFDGAIRALALETLQGQLAKQARASYIDRYGNPKWVGFMPESVAVDSPEGDEMFDAIDTLMGPEGFGVLPHGADYKTAQMQAGQNSVFDSALDNVWRFVAAILLGSDGTMSPSTGVYSAPIFAGVRRDLIDRMLKAIVRAVNAGHVAPWLALNYAASIAEAKGWKSPVLEIPLPDPAKDERIKSFGERAEKLTTLIREERSAGMEVTQERVNQLAKELDVPAPTLATKEAAKTWNVELAPSTQEKILTVDEGRAAIGGDPLGGERGGLLIVELDQKLQADREAAAAEAEAQAEADAAIEVDEETNDEEAA